MINIIGAGLAGLSAALTLAENGIKCRLISAQQSERAQSVLAEGGINAALNTMGENDTPELHFEETMKGGCYLADPNSVEALTQSAPAVVKKLAFLGVPFNRNANGSIMLRSFGGQKKKRTAFAQSSTGKMIMTALIDEVRKYEAQGLVDRFPHHTFVRIIIENGKCNGVCVRDDSDKKLYDIYGSVIMCSGGLNGFFPGTTTGTVTNSGNAASVLFAQGVKFANLEMIQYHPTTFAIPGKRCLVSEAARGEGGRLFSERGGKRCYFMEERYPELGNLMPRDVVSREMFRELQSSADTFLDMTGINAAVWRGKLSDLRSEIMHYLAIDPAKKPVPVQPAIHYFMGGIYVNERQESSIKGLYAAGECACQYHGANRLGGNSLLGAICGGITAARNVTSDNSDVTEAYNSSEPFASVPSPMFVKETGAVLTRGLGIIRNASELQKALNELNAVKCENAVELARRELAAAMLMSALERKESRGAHYREDFPETKEKYRRTTVSVYENDRVNISFEDIPERRNE
ncbi:MAG: FAD-binding protein [Ruminiclostridium sp.]|nr:FAD-binding protein [Ruminiclostridium sp.]